MQPKYLHNVNGKEIVQSDVNTWSTAASAADDQVFSQLVRMIAFTAFGSSRGILPTVSGKLVEAAGSVGSVRVWPFRAFIGSTVLPSVDTTDNWNGIRTQLYINPTSTVYNDFQLSNNASGNPRWDLLYAKVEKDATIDSSVRYVKTETGTTISEGPTTIVNVVNTVVTLGVVEGTPGNPPVFPSQPSDTTGIYYIPLAGIRVTAGFDNTVSTIASTDIFDCGSIVVLSDTTGTITFRPANSLNSVDGAVLTKPVLGLGDWGFTGSRPNVYMPPSMIGGEVLMCAIDVLDASSTNWSHPSGSVIDNSRDWRNRIFVVFGTTVGGAISNTFAFSPSPVLSGLLPLSTYTLAGGVAFNGIRDNINDTLAPHYFGFGQSFVDEGGGQSLIFNISQANSKIHAGDSLNLYVDQSNGSIKMSCTSTPTLKLFLCILASAPFSNL